MSLGLQGMRPAGRPLEKKPHAEEAGAMTPGRITTMTSSQIPQLWSSLRDRVPTSFFFILYPAEPATPATQVHRSRSLPGRFHTQAQAPANA